MTLTRYAFIKANWHSDIVDQALTGFSELIPLEQIDVFDVPGAFEMPLVARDLAASGQYAAVAAAAFVVDGGIYRHDFVAQAVVDGLMRAGMDTGVPVLSVSLTPHQYQATCCRRGKMRDQDSPAPATHRSRSAYRLPARNRQVPARHRRSAAPHEAYPHHQPRQLTHHPRRWT